MDIAVIGEDEFTLGFRLTGIRNVSVMKSESDMVNLLSNKTLGIIITSQKSFDSMSEEVKEDVTNSIRPVVVVVSDKPQEGLRKMIIRSIGVDLLKGD